MVSIFLANDLTVGASSSGYDRYIPAKRGRALSIAVPLGELFLIQFDFAVEAVNLVEAVALFTAMTLELLSKTDGLLVYA